jgi:hypothetical protein
MSIFGRQTHGHFEHHVRESLEKQPLHPETLSIVAGTTSDVSKLKLFIEFCSCKAMESSTDASSWAHVKTLIESRLSELEVPSVADRLDVSQNAYELTSPFATRLTPSVNTLRQRSQATARAHMITSQSQGSDPKATSTVHRSLFDDDDA